MDISKLPTGDSPAALATPHFPTRQQAVVWRNWEMVPPARLARVLGTGTREVLALARGLGLRTPPRVNPDWLKSGYCTIIRDNWHLLPYGQLLTLLGWAAERLEFTLREDDFLWIKVGRSKPLAQPATYAPLSAAERAATRRLRDDLRRHLPTPRRGGEASFAFMQAWDRVPRRTARTFDPAAPLRLAYSFTASCGDNLLDPGREPYPDGLLARYADLGVNAIWLHGLLHTLYPWDAFPGLSAGWEVRIASLRRLVRRAARFGIGVYLYLNEPRGLPPALFTDRPDLQGTTFPDSVPLGLCTSNPEIQRFLREGSRHLFSQVPALAGVFTITMSENPTNCFSRPDPVKACPHCARRGAAEVIAGVNRLIAEGAHAAAPSARVIAWTWGWKPEWDLDAIDRLPADVGVMCVSEWGLPTAVGGIAGTVIDYSISQVGPSEQSLRLWRRAQARGLRTVAKVQLNNSWELSSVPWIPVPDLVARHLGRLRGAGVEDVMVGWTVGGYPGGNLALLDHPAADLAVRDFGASAAPLVRRAWSAFSRAFAQLPFSCDTIYNSPLNVGPANLLHPVPSGRRASMVLGFPYDDLAGWRAIYPEAVFERQLGRLATGWRRGVDLLGQAAHRVPAAKRSNLAELERIAQAADCHFRSTWLQVRFVRARDRAPGASRTRALLAIVREERRVACTLIQLVRVDSRLGFEAANQYSYSLNGLAEKIIQCAWIERWLLGGGGS